MKRPTWGNVLCIWQFKDTDVFSKDKKHIMLVYTTERCGMGARGQKLLWPEFGSNKRHAVKFNFIILSFKREAQSRSPEVFKEWWLIPWPSQKLALNLAKSRLILPTCDLKLRMVYTRWEAKQQRNLRKHKRLLVFDLKLTKHQQKRSKSFTGGVMRGCHRFSRSCPTGQTGLFRNRSGWRSGFHRNRTQATGISRQLLLLLTWCLVFNCQSLLTWLL